MEQLELTEKDMQQLRSLLGEDGSERAALSLVLVCATEETRLKFNAPTKAFFCDISCQNSITGARFLVHALYWDVDQDWEIVEVRS